MDNFVLQNLNISGIVDNEEVSIVNDFSLKIGAKEHVAIIGESGCGKSMIAMSLFSLLPANCRLNGDIILNDCSIINNLESLRGKELSLVPQGAKDHLNSLLKVKKQMLQECKRLKLSKKEAEEKIKNALEAVGFNNYEEILDMYPFELSGGMGQKVILAISLLSNPLVIVLDEPTNGLDNNSKDQFMKLYKEIFKDKMSLFITHDLDILDYFDRICIMYEGRLIEVTDSIENVRHPYSIALRESQAKYGLKSINKIDSNKSYYCTFYSYCNIRGEKCLKESPKMKDGVLCHNA